MEAELTEPPKKLKTDNYAVTEEVNVNKVITAEDKSSNKM